MLVIGAAAAALVSGCVEQQVFVKQDVTYDRYERDFVGCSTKATQAVATNTQVGWAPYVGIYSYDTNTALRVKNFEICMRDLGYQQVQMPFCSGARQTAAMAAAKAPQDRNRKIMIQPNSCYVNRADGTMFLYSA
jgi:hypothetical protein